MVFDLLAFWASFRAVGTSPELAVIWMAYLIGQLGNWFPVPGELWIPAALGLAAFVQLRLLLRRETDAINLCQPGETVELIGLGPATLPNVV